MGFACGSREVTPVYPVPKGPPSQPAFMEEKWLLTPWTGLGQVAGGGGEVGQPRVVAEAGCNMSGLSWKLDSVLSRKNTLFFFFLKII